MCLIVQRFLALSTLEEVNLQSSTKSCRVFHLFLHRSNLYPIHLYRTYPSWFGYPPTPPPRRLDEALWPQCRDSRSPGVPMPRDGSNTLIFQPLGAKSGSSSPQRRASVSHPRGHPPLDGAELGKCWGWKTPRDHPRAFVRGGAPVAVGVTTCFLCALACQKRGAVRMRVGDA